MQKNFLVKNCAVLTRCYLCDESNEIPGAFVFVKHGNLYEGTGWVQTVDDPDVFTMGINNISIIQFTSAGTYTAGEGLDLNGTEFSVDGTVVRSQDLTTSNVSEVSNLYFTNARVYSNVTQLNYATNAQITNFATIGMSVTVFQNDAGYLTSANLSGYATNGQLSGYATTANLSGYATNVQLSGYATTANLSGYATNVQLSGYATTINYLATLPMFSCLVMQQQQIYLGMLPMFSCLVMQQQQI